MNPGTPDPNQPLPTVHCVGFPTYALGGCAHTGNTATVCTQFTCIPHTGAGIVTFCPPADSGAQAQAYQPTGVTSPETVCTLHPFCPPAAGGGAQNQAAYTGNTATICTQIGYPSPAGGAQFASFAATLCPTTPLAGCHHAQQAAPAPGPIHPTTYTQIGPFCNSGVLTIVCHQTAQPNQQGAQAQLASFPPHCPTVPPMCPHTTAALSPTTTVANFTHNIVQCCTAGTTIGAAPAQAQTPGYATVNCPPPAPAGAAYQVGAAGQAPTNIPGCTTITSTPPTYLPGCNTATTPPAGHYTFNFPGCTTVTSAPGQAQVPPTQLFGCTTVTSTPPTFMPPCPVGYTHNFPGCTTVTSTPPTHLLGCTTVTSTPGQAQVAPTQLFGCTTVTATPTHLMGCTTVTATPPQAQPATVLPVTTVCLPPSITCPPADGGAATPAGTFPVTFLVRTVCVAAPGAAPAAAGTIVNTFHPGGGCGPAAGAQAGTQFPVTIGPGCSFTQACPAAPAQAQAVGNTMSIIAPTACAVTQLAHCGGVTGIPFVC